jgi:isoquinoline 1-oxidoreductase beta subunit
MNSDERRSTSTSSVHPPLPKGEVMSDDEVLTAPAEFDFAMTRRSFVQVLGAGILVSAVARPLLAQRGERRGDPVPISARIHLGKDGSITVLSGKVEIGQGARTELSQAAAEELRVPVERIQMVLGDTALVPDDGITAGSRTTPETVPAVRQAAAAVRALLVAHAAQQWNVQPEAIEVRDGVATDATGRTLGYADLAQDEQAAQSLSQAVPEGVTLTPVSQWRVLGTPVRGADRRPHVTGEHKYPSDLARDGMLYGKVLRSTNYGAKLVSVDLGPAQAMQGVVAVRDGQFIGVAAPTSHVARQAIDAITPTAKWDNPPQPNSTEVYDYLRQHADGGVPPNPFADELATASKVLRQTYHVAYVQHVPLEPRTALAEWSSDGKLTVWTGTQNPFGVHAELCRALRLSDEDVRVIVPDFGSGYGGKHTGEAAIEAARLARAAGRPVHVRWTREEEFAWAYFRPAAVIDVQASLDAQKRLTSWHFVNINSGPAAIDTPYKVAKNRSQFVKSQEPLRQGSYRALAATANNFARESFMDELAAEASIDPLDFRLAHLENERLRAVLEEAARQFKWREQVGKHQPDRGIGLACGTEKGSCVAACVEVAIKAQKQIEVVRVCEVFECGAILNPDNLRSQVEGCIIMGLGPALREEMKFKDGVFENATFRRYRVPHFSDVPTVEVHLLNRPDLPSAGGGETPIIAIAPAIANAVYHATGTRTRQMPIRLAADTGDNGGEADANA